MRDCTTTTEDVFLTGKTKVVLPIVFGDAFESVPCNDDPVFVDVFGE